MSEQTLSPSSSPSFVSRSIVSVQSDEEPFVRKWPRGWRYLLVFGSALLFWFVVIALILWT